METPSNKAKDYRPSRTFTPRLSERKKKLFATNSPKAGKQQDLRDDDVLLGMTPLRSTRRSQNCVTPKSKRNIDPLLLQHTKGVEARGMTSILSTESESDNDKANASPKRRSMRLNLKNSSPGNKENNEGTVRRVPTAEEQQLQELFNESMTLDSQQLSKPHNASITIDETSDEELLEELMTNASAGNTQKRQLLATAAPTGVSPKRKVAKVSPTAAGISTKSFYAARQQMPQIVLKPITLHGTGSTTSKTSPRSRRSNTHSSAINRGVKHKIRKRPHPNHNMQARPSHSIDIDVILGNLRNERLRALITSKRQEREQIEKVHNIFRQAENPIQMARPLSVISNDDKNNNNNNNNNTILSNKNEQKGDAGPYADENDFSDIDYDSDEDESIFGYDMGNKTKDTLIDKEEVIPIITHQLNGDGTSAGTEQQESTVPSNRKFFKSKRTNVMEVRITENIRASVYQGKISLVEEKKRRKPRRSRPSNHEFSDEQATVNAILKNLDDTAFGDLIDSALTPSLSNGTAVDETTQMQAGDDMQQLELYSNDLLSDIQLEDSNDYADFRNRLPYNTDDPTLIEQQHLLLDFLISNNICTEENFKIFIADPDNHKEEASRIIDRVVIVLNKEQMKYRDKLPYNTTDPAVIEQQYNFLNFLMENDICDEEHFDIFIANYAKRKPEADAIIARVQAELQKQLQQQPSTNGQVMAVQPMQTAEQQTIGSSHEHQVATGRALRTESPTMQALIYNDFSALIEPTTAVTPQTVALAEPPPSEKGEKLFPIFTNPSSGLRAYPLSVPQSTRRTQAQRQWQGGYGATQMQIDAGQRQFGATQCKQCGLLYTMHEPEEERLHREYHASLHILRFKGWIDEDIVAIYPEWGNDGRILRLKDTSLPKRKERLQEILRIVDKELGFSSYIMPSVFVAYLAVRKSQIVGVCLAQPLQKANKYLCINGVDCCTEETFDVKCGISRIWVSPMHRRLHIAAKLVTAVQLNTIVGEDIPFDKLAFSAPTEMGRLFAQKITRMSDFLVYQ